MKNTKQQVRLPGQRLDEDIQQLAMIELTSLQIISTAGATSTTEEIEQ